MNKEKFLLDVQDALEIESVLAEDTNLKELDEWDSMTAMILIAYVSDNFEIQLGPKDILDLTTVRSLIMKIGEEKFK